MLELMQFEGAPKDFLGYPMPGVAEYRFETSILN